MARCKCQKRDKKQCTRKGSKKADQNPVYCWQHQKCKKDFDAVDVAQTELPKGPVKEGKAKPFIQQGTQMVAYDLINGSAGLGTDDAVTIENVAGGLWEIRFKGHADNKGEIINHTEFEILSTGINTKVCEWEFEGVVPSKLGMVGVFDLGTLKKMSQKEMEDVAKTSKPENFYKYGIYLQTLPDRECEISVCYDTKGKVVAIRGVVV